MRRVRLAVAATLTLLLCGCAAKYQNVTNELMDRLRADFAAGRAVLDCELNCAGLYGANRRTLRTLHDTEQWAQLADKVLVIGFTDQQSWYYLGRAAYGLGYHEAAIRYLEMAAHIRGQPMKCYSTCDGFVFPRDAQTYIDKARAALQPAPIARATPTPPKSPTPKAAAPASSARAAAAMPARPSSAAAAPAATKPGASSLSSLRYPKAATRPDDIAVIIGNKNYRKHAQDIPDVTPAHADANAFRKYAIEGLGIDPENIIDLRDATVSDFVRVFGTAAHPDGELYDWVKPNRSRVVVYYSGHGAPGKDSAYLVPVDADADRIEQTGFALSALYDNLAKVPAPQVTLVLEACFSGNSQAGAVIRRASPIFADSRPSVIPTKLTVLSATHPEQIASWEKDSSNGLFTKYFLKGMAGEADAAPHGNGDGRVEMDELDAYLRETLTYYARRLYGREQVARITGVTR